MYEKLSFKLEFQKSFYFDFLDTTFKLFDFLQCSWKFQNLRDLCVWAQQEEILIEPQYKCLL